MGSGELLTAAAARDGRWCRAAGLAMLGEAQGSGLRQSSYLLRRADGQVLQVSELLYLVVRELSPNRSAEQVVEAVSASYGRELTPDGLIHLIESRLQPLGLIVESTADAEDAVSAPRANPLLSLSLRGTLIPARAVRIISRVLAPTFFPPVVALALGAFVVLDVVLIRRGDLTTSLVQVLGTPSFLLALFGLLIAGAIVHELGHAAACRYGGATPGRIGFGVYILFPAFYTDVTDSYRLGRAGRVRTDLGGLYFNVWWVLALGGTYLVTGNGLFLLAVVLVHLEMAQQLLPAVRFDGYWVLSDVAGVPDLFARVRPVLASILPGRQPDPRVAELRPAARRLVIGWVVIVVPLLLVGFGWLLFNLPFFVRTTVSAMTAQWEVAVSAWRDGDIALLALASISVLILAIPLLGLAVLLWRLAASIIIRLMRLGSTRRSPHPPTPNAHPEIIMPTSKSPGQSFSERAASANGATPSPQEQPEAPERSGPRTAREKSGRSELTAAAFTDEAMLKPPRAPAQRGWRRGVYAISGHTINPGPGVAERRRAELEQRLRAPIDGSRRVVVMSRKGGVGKTTMTLAIGSTFAMLRGDRVIAVDANPDAGNLAHRVAPPCPRNITDVLDDIERISSYAELRSYTSQAVESRLEVLASDDDPRIGMALERRHYHQLIKLLDHYYNLILLDTGTGILDSANQGLLAEADQLVLVLRPGVDGGRAAALTLDWLDQHDYGELVAKAVVVVNGVRPGVGAPLEPIEDHFSRRCSRVILVPWDRALETGAQTALSALRNETRQGLVDVAAAVADNFVKTGATR
ncbi:MAG: MinD/ParA family ATP-binding protein [Jiangellaceae bacterium]